MASLNHRGLGGGSEGGNRNTEIAEIAEIAEWRAGGLDNQLVLVLVLVLVIVLSAAVLVLVLDA